jgi:hypothetical protein
MKEESRKHHQHDKSVEWVLSARGESFQAEAFQRLFVFSIKADASSGSKRKAMVATNGARMHIYLPEEGTPSSLPKDGVYNVYQVPNKITLTLINDQSPLKKGIMRVLEKNSAKLLGRFTYKRHFSPKENATAFQIRMEELGLLVKELYKNGFNGAIDPSYLIDAYEMDGSKVEISWYDDGLFVMRDEHHIAMINTIN